VLASLGDGAIDAEARTGGRVLATGDSMIQYVDAALEQRLERRRRVRVASDAHVSTGLSKPSLLNWPRYAKRQVRRYKPRVTGHGSRVTGHGDVNRGQRRFPMTGRSGRSVPCCGRAWQGEYARRATQMMRTYNRGGDGRVYWLLLPQARGGSFRKVFPAVNAGLRRAARPFGSRLRLIHLDRVFTPRGRFRSVMRYRSRLATVRQPDGVHLTQAGAAIAADKVVAAMDRDHALGRRRKVGAVLKRAFPLPRRSSPARSRAPSGLASR